MAKFKKQAPHKPETGVCVYCGRRGVMTFDDVIPKCLFPIPRPKDLIKILACSICNNEEKSNDDEYLRDFLAADIQSWAHPAMQEHAFVRFEKSLRKSALARDAITRMKPTDWYTPSGLYRGKVYVADLPGERVTRIISRMTCGLYRHYFDDSLPFESTFVVQRIRDFSKILPLAQALVSTNSAKYVTVGDGTIFNCVYGRDTEQPRISLWFLSFYSGVVFMVVTNRTAEDAIDALTARVMQERDT